MAILKTYSCGPFRFRRMTFEKTGDQVTGHKHNFDHVSSIQRGGWRVEELDEQGNVLRTVEKFAGKSIPPWINIPAGKIHRITALEDGTIGECQYVHRNGLEEVVEFDEGWEPGYV